MNFNVIFRGVIANFVIDLVLAFFLIHYQFSMTAQCFTILLMVGLFIVSLFEGASSEKFGQVNGAMIGLLSAFILFIFLGSVAHKIDWILNLWILCACFAVGFFGGLAGLGLAKKAKD